MMGTSGGNTGKRPPEDGEDQLADTILVAGTASHVGKSTVAAGLCRLLARADVAVAPFKAQNMANNGRVVPRSTSTIEGNPDAGIIAASQAMQARAAGIAPETDCNPVVLQPRTDQRSRLVINGQVVGTYDACTYFDSQWEDARDAAVAAWKRLAKDHEVVIAEGAGAIGELNLQDRDLANIETARMADASILLVADIERGGVFASLLGTLELLPTDLRERVAGVVITKFRGDRELLSPGIEEFIARTGVPVMGVMPYTDIDLPEEDSLGRPDPGTTGRWGAGEEAGRTRTVAVPNLPNLGDTPDCSTLAAIPGVEVSFRPPGDGISDADAVVVPATTQPTEDLAACRDENLGEQLTSASIPVVAVGTGTYLLGESLTIAETGDCHAGLGVLPIESTVSSAHHPAVLPVSGAGSEWLDTGTETVSGYAHRQGTIESTEPVETPLTPDDTDWKPLDCGLSHEGITATPLQGLFTDPAVCASFMAAIDPTETVTAATLELPYDQAAGLLADSIAVETIPERGGWGQVSGALSDPG